MIIYGTAKDLAFKPSNQKVWLDFLEANDGKKLVVDINLEKSRRSLNANAYLWGVVYELISRHTGHTSEELHEIYSRMFLKPRFIKYKEKEIKLPTGTSDLDKLEFMEYTDRVIAEGASLGVEIPPPNTQKEEFDIKVAHANLEVPEGEVKF